MGDWIRRRAGHVAALALVLISLPALAAGVQADTGQPLTKEQYFERSFDFYSHERRLLDLYYAMELKRLTKRQCARRLRQMHRIGANLVAEVRGIVPPPEVASQHASLVEAGAGVVKRIGKLRGPFARGKLRCGDLGSRLYSIIDDSRLDEIEAELGEAGYLPSGA